MSHFKNKVLKILAPYQYPQFIFAKEIIGMLIENGFKSGTILDCPCGNGEVCYHLSKAFSTAVVGCDINKTSIEHATENFSNKNLVFQHYDIFNYLSKEKLYEAVCIVNSLFLLPDHDRLITLINGRLKIGGLLLILTPNINGPNFKSFQKSNSAINKTILNSAEIKERFEKNGFKLNNQKDIVFAAHYKHKYVNYLSVLAPFYLLGVNYLKKLRKQKRQGNYILYCFSKNYETN